MKVNTKELKNQYIEKLSEVKKLKKLTAKQLETLSDLQLSDKWSECIDLLEKIKNGQSVNTDYNFQETEDSYILTIPKNSLLNEEKISEKGKPYTLLYKIGTKWGMEKLTINGNNMGLTFSLTRY